MSAFHEPPEFEPTRTPGERFEDLLGIALALESSSAASLTLRAQKYLGAVYRLSSLAKEIAALPSVGDIDGVSVNGAWTDATDATLHITLKRQDSALLREIVAVGITRRITKRVGITNASLTAEFTRERIAVEIDNYKPASCRLVEEEVERQVENPRIDEHGNVYILEKKIRVHCEPPEVDETPDASPPAEQSHQVPF